jgi:hypothetical protein
VVADEPADPPASRQYDIVTLARLAAERARVTGNAGSESWSPLVVAYLRPQMRAGLLVVQPTADVQPYAPLWFEALMPADLVEALEQRRKNRRRQ